MLLVDMSINVVEDVSNDDTRGVAEGLRGRPNIDGDSSVYMDDLALCSSMLARSLLFSSILF